MMTDSHRTPWDWRSGVELVALLVFAAGCSQPDDGNGSAPWIVQNPTADAAPAGTPTRLRLFNESDQSVHVQVARSDCSGNPGWFRLRRDGKRLQLWHRCGTCLCREVRDGDCPTQTCPGSCAVGQIEAIESGEQIDHQWDGRHWMKTRHEGALCLRDVAPEEGERIDVTFCWGLDADNDPRGPEILSVRCATEKLIYGRDRTVTHRIQ